VAEGKALYEKNKHEAALQKYTRAQALLPNSPILSYNMGNVHFRQKDYDKAVEAYGKAAQAPDKALAEAALFNAGNAQFAKEDYLQAIEMYKQALQLDPEDRDAKANLELARRKLKERSKPQQQDQQQQ
jgi:Ca-activated chloride channel family protein